MFPFLVEHTLTKKTRNKQSHTNHKCCELRQRCLQWYFPGTLGALGQSPALQNKSVNEANRRNANPRWWRPPGAMVSKGLAYVGGVTCVGSGARDHSWQWPGEESWRCKGSRKVSVGAMDGNGKNGRWRLKVSRSNTEPLMQHRAQRVWVLLWVQ